MLCKKVRFTSDECIKIKELGIILFAHNAHKFSLTRKNQVFKAEFELFMQAFPATYRFRPKKILQSESTNHRIF